jgi:hypothetical protein
MASTAHEDFGRDEYELAESIFHRHGVRPETIPMVVSVLHRSHDYQFKEARQLAKACYDRLAARQR